MTDSRFNYLKKTVSELCPRGNKYFCDGTVNKSWVKEEEGLLPLPPCKMMESCPVRRLAREYDDSQ